MPRELPRLLPPVAGSFPGNPVSLDHVFEIKDDRISSLEIR
jgi:hypothetical protein